MPVCVSCPHCRTPCLVAEQYLGVPVKCGRCARTFTTRADPAIRLDLGVATSPGDEHTRQEDSFLVHHLVCCNLDDRHELAVLVVADGRSDTIKAALMPLLSSFLGGASKDAARVSEAIAACKGIGATAAVVVVWDGQAQIGQVGECRVYHQCAGQLVQVMRDPMKLAVGDWLVVACARPHAHLNPSTLQETIAKASPFADQLARQLVERANQLGCDNCTVVTVRCY